MSYNAAASTVTDEEAGDAPAVAGRRWEWIPIVIVMLGIFTSDASRGIVLPSMWEMTLHLGGNKAIYGTAMAVFSVGRVSSGLVYGWWVDRHSYKWALIVSFMLILGGSIMYAFAVNTAMLIASRVVCGMGAGNLTMLRSYLANMIDTDRRTLVFSIASAMQFAGAFFAPGFGAAGTLIPLPAGAGSGFIAAFFGLLCAVLVLLGIRARHEPPAKLKKRWEPINGDGKQLPLRHRCSVFWSDFDNVGAVLFLVFNLLSRLDIAILASVVPLWSHHFSHEPASQTVTGSALFLMICGSVGIAMLIVIALLNYKGVVPELSFFYAGLLLLLAGSLTLIPYSDTFTEPQFYAGNVVAIGLGYPLLHALIVSMFSKFVTSNTGLMMGILAAFGSVGQISGPFITGFAMHNLVVGERVLFILLAGTLFLTTGASIVYFVAKAKRAAVVQYETVP